MPDLVQDVREALRRDGPESASALARRLGISTPTVTRALAKLGDAVVTIGKGRSSRYALYRGVRDRGHAWPLFRINEKGEPERLGQIEALHGRYRWRLMPERPLPLYMHGEFAAGLYEDLPWFLQALRPQGYLGRESVRFFADDVGAPQDISRWQADDILLGLLHFGADLPGNLLLLDRFAQQDLASILQQDRAACDPHHMRSELYPVYANESDQAGQPGSSAAGEQPKFTTTLIHEDSSILSVIVKFASLDTGNPTAQRWADLLICEETASRMLSAHSIHAAHTEILDADDWRFLQSTRFDRTPQGGRIGVFALDALDMAYIGSDQRDWLAGAEPLHTEGLIDSSDLDRVRLLNAFGRCIGNNDMHHGNLGFFAEPERTALRLAPVYDMLPMHYRPAVSGLVRKTSFELPAPDPHYLTIWAQAAILAAEFWATAAGDKRLSKPFARLCADNHIRILEWKALHSL